MAAGILVSVVLISFNLFWQNLVSTPSYSGSYVNASAKPAFQNILGNSSSISSLITGKDGIQAQIQAMKAPSDPLTLILSVLSLVAKTLFAILILVLVVPIMLIDIIVSSLSIFGDYISIEALVGGFVLIFFIRGVMALFRDQGAVR